MTFFFEFSLGPFKVVEAEGGRLVKEADFEAEKKNTKKNYSAFHVMAFFTLQVRTLVLIENEA